MSTAVRAAIYARVSTSDQTTENQLAELRAYAAARGWTVKEFVDSGLSGATDSRPALDAMLKEAKRRRFDVVACWSLDRLGRSLKHLVTVLDDLQALGVSFVSVREGLDWTTPAGRLQAQLLAMIAEFERARIRERVVAGLARVKAAGKKLGRKPVAVTDAQFRRVAHLSVRAAGEKLGISHAVVHRWRLSQKPLSA